MLQSANNIQDWSQAV